MGISLAGISLVTLLILSLLVFLISWMFIVIIIYFIPTIIAVIRKHQNIIPICILNIFLGWTILGWIASLAWSLNSDVEEKKEDTNN